MWVQAVRNFVQLCMEGYYDNTIFHRAMRDYMVQGGDPSGTGTGIAPSLTCGIFHQGPRTAPSCIPHRGRVHLWHAVQG